MALSWPSPTPFSLFQSHKHSPLVSETIIPNRVYSPPGKSLFSFSTSISSVPNLGFSSLFPRIFCSTSSDSASAYGDSYSTSIFIKGLPQSTSEGRLKKAFSEFGEINQVKILTDKISGQSLGLAYVWFAKEKFAHLAVKQMNGKFFDGRFILVTPSNPKSSKNKRTLRQYKF